MSDNSNANLSDKVVVITGAGRGQGLEEARQARKQGAIVVGVDLDFPDSGDDVFALTCQFDVSDGDAWRSLAETLADEYEVVHGLVNNAGIAHREPLLEVPQKNWNHTLSVNLTGPLLGMQALVPLMTAGGSVVNINSVAGLTGYRATAYTVSKWGLRGLSRVASNELGHLGVRVNTVFPGYIDTPLVRQTSETFRDEAKKVIPMGRSGQVQDVAPIVLFLLSDQASWITGAEITVDGGQYAHGGTRSFAGPWPTTQS